MVISLNKQLLVDLWIYFSGGSLEFVSMALKCFWVGFILFSGFWLVCFCDQDGM